MARHGAGATLSLPRLHLILDPSFCRARGIDPVEVAAQVIAAGAHPAPDMAVHLRGPGLPADEFWRLAMELRALIGPPALLLINDRVDIAVAAGADGVQLGSHGLPLDAARRVAGGHILVGRSVHNVREAQEAEREGADYVLLGTIYPTASHPTVTAGGVELVGAVRAAVHLPIIAIGGIDAGNARDVLQAGAQGVAVMRGIAEASDAKRAMTSLYQAIVDSSNHSPPTTRHSL